MNDEEAFNRWLERQLGDDLRDMTLAFHASHYDAWQAGIEHERHELRSKLARLNELADMNGRVSLDVLVDLLGDRRKV